MDFSRLIPIKVGFCRVAHHYHEPEKIEKQPYLCPLWVIEDKKAEFGFHAIGLPSQYWMGLN